MKRCRDCNSQCDFEKLITQGLASCQDSENCSTCT